MVKKVETPSAKFTKVVLKNKKAPNLNILIRIRLSAFLFKDYTAFLFEEENDG